MHGTSRSEGTRSLYPSSGPGPGGRQPGHNRGRDWAGAAAGNAERGAPREAHVYLRLPVEADSVATAHHCVFDIATALDPDAVDDVRLLVSELVTNAIRHARLAPDDWIELQVDLENHRVRVEVRDPGPGFDPTALPASKPPGAEGWGLLLVRRIASRWGVERDGQTCVWFELDLASS